MHRFLILCSLYGFILGICSCTHEPFEGAEDIIPNKSATTVEWTAYKYSSKLAVSGQFNHVELILPPNSTKGIEALEGLEIFIHTKSLDSQSSERNQNIIDYYFSYLVDSEVIYGRLESINEDGTAQVLISLNSIEQSMPFDFELYESEQRIMFSATLDLEEWSAATALKHFDSCCISYHTGDDGINLVWPIIDIKVSASLDDL